MISQKLIRHSRAVCARSQPIISSPLSQSYNQPFRICPSTDTLSPRCYSTAPETVGDSKGEAPKDRAPETQPNNEDPKQKEIDSKTREIIDLKDKYLRSVADFRNLQDRTKRDIDSARSFAISRFATDLMESVDNLDRALSTVAPEKVSQPDSNKELTDLYQGLKMTDSILMQTLKKHGLERFDPSVEGELFNPNLHEATFQTKAEGRKEGTVFVTQQKGFLLNGRVVRAAKVGVVKNS